MKFFEDAGGSLDTPVDQGVQLDPNSFWGQIMAKIEQFFAFIKQLFQQISDAFSGLMDKLPKQ